MRLRQLAFVLLAGLAFNSGGATLYVSPQSANPMPPYASWPTAATNIQEAIDAASAGDEVMVTNGVYATGGRAVSGAMTNRMAITKALTVRSVNGPGVTFIAGAPAPGGTNGDGAIRCVFAASNAILSGFTLSNGHTRSSGDKLMELNGGGVWCEPGARVRNCIISSNSASGDGGGAYQGRLENCELTANSAAYGGGAQGSTLLNCTVVRNYSTSRLLGGGIALATCLNCIVQLNSYSGNYANYSQSLLNYCCSSPMPTNGVGNITNLPAFVDLEGGNLRLQCGSPGIDNGTNLAEFFSDDLRGHNRPIDGNSDGATAFDMGAYERDPAYDTADIGIRAGFTNFALRFPAPFFAQIDGCAGAFWWDFGDGVFVTNQNPVVHGWTSPGNYTVRLSAQFSPSGALGTTTAMVQVVEANYYVDASNSSPAHPYGSWSTAATSIQAAVDAGTALGRLVLVTNGIYQYGGFALHSLMTNRVTLTNGVRLQSVNGPAATLIVGGAAPSGGTGDGAVRCLYADKLSIVDGFTLTNGHTLESSTVDVRLHDGGGVWCEPAATITNCVITRNSADYFSGGAHQGNLYNCVLSFNVGYYGGGASYASLVNCVVMSNSTYSAEGGGVIYSTLSNCTVVGNAAPWWANGVKGCSVYNSILYYNSPVNIGGIVPTVCSYSCTTPLPSGTGNLDKEPRLVDLAAGDFGLLPDSPCINAGKNAYVATSSDLEGNPRIQGGTVDIGAYEFQSPGSLLSYAWAQEYGLRTDGSADNGDADGDHMTNWQEWVADTNPTNASSSLKFVTQSNSASGIVVSWESAGTRAYYLDRGGSPGGPFSAIASNIIGRAGTTSFADTTATNRGPYFYRIGIQ